MTGDRVEPNMGPCRDREQCVASQVLARYICVLDSALDRSRGALLGSRPISSTDEIMSVWLANGGPMSKKLEDVTV